MGPTLSLAGLSMLILLMIAPNRRVTVYLRVLNSISRFGRSMSRVAGKMKWRLLVDGIFDESKGRVRPNFRVV